MTGYIRSQGATLAANGIPVVPIAPCSKRPIGKNWQLHPLSERECRSYPDASAGVGILFGSGETPIYGIDADIDGDEEFAAAFRDYLFPMAQPDMTRVGKPPKFLMLVRMEGLPRPKRTSPFFEKDGRRIRLEFLGRGQQAVAFGIHPDTRKEYHWDSLWYNIDELKPEWLPVITQEQQDEIFKKFTEMALERGYVECRQDAESAKDIKGDESLAGVLEPPMQPLGLTLEDAETLILESGIDNENYDSWIRVGMALHHEFAEENPVRALDIWDQWSSTAKSYQQPDKVSGLCGREMLEAKWESFGKRSYGFSITMRWVQKNWRKNNVEAQYAKELNETGLVFRFLKVYGERVRYVHDVGAWYLCGESDNIWAPVEKSSNRVGIRWLIQKIVMEDLYNESLKADSKTASEIVLFRSKKMANLGWVPRVESQLKASPALWARQSDFDGTGHFFAMGNGVFDLVNGDFLATLPDYMIQRHSKVIYQKEAKCPLWEQTVRECLSEDEEKIAYFKRWCGYTLIGNPTEMKFHIFEGDGGNGKTMLLNILSKVHGGYYTSVDSSLFTAKRFETSDAERPQPALASLVGVRLVLCSEVEQGAKLRESLVKRLTGLEPISARKIYGRSPIVFRPKAVIVLATNYKPEVAGVDSGIWRRQEFLKFERNFLSDPNFKVDKHREEKLMKELPGIFNWMVEGLRDFEAKGGLCPPESVEKEVGEFRVEMDVFGKWMDDNWEVTGNLNDKVKTSYLWRKWVIYAKEANYVDLIRNPNSLTRRVRAYLSRQPKHTDMYRSGGNTKIAGIRPVKDDGSADVEEANRAAEDFQKKE